MAQPESISVEALAAQLSSCEGRRIVALAGPPASGKSTIAEALRTRLNRRHPGLCEVLPMDGYHFDDTYLGAMGWQARKGAPHTFDVGGLAAMLVRIKANTEPEIAVPVFDRKLEIARAGARMIKQNAKVIIVEGNYLLLDTLPWAALRPCFDITVMLDVPTATLEARLSARWAGFGYSAADAEGKIAGNDMLNVNEVINNSVPADYVV